ncbi:hypothetical protein GCM10023176_61100 [Micromonospora coerulea]|uniref:Endonuclease/exonuclease/phosphatase domain-containing protein n=1 Tax=Micromonospora coerulea TaxID=47856 RepID=A0ABP8T6Q8_9ACTN
MHLNEVLAAAAVDGQPGMPMILCGDLNDGPDAVTTVLLEGPADGDVHRPDKGDAVRLYNLGRRLPPARAYSRIYQGRGELIDHILATRDLQLRLGSIDSLVDDITSIGASTRSREAVIVPDHAPVVARFTGLQRFDAVPNRQRPSVSRSASRRPGRRAAARASRPRSAIPTPAPTPAPACSLGQCAPPARRGSKVHSHLRALGATSAGLRLSAGRYPEGVFALTEE